MNCPATGRSCLNAIFVMFLTNSTQLFDSIKWKLSWTINCSAASCKKAYFSAIFGIIKAIISTFKILCCCIYNADFLKDFYLHLQDVGNRVTLSTLMSQFSLILLGVIMTTGEQLGNNWGTTGEQLGNNWGTTGETTGEQLGNKWGTSGEQVGNNWGTTGKQLGNNWGTTEEQLGNNCAVGCRHKSAVGKN
jgi:hypothetical protein